MKSQLMKAIDENWEIMQRIICPTGGEIRVYVDPVNPSQFSITCLTMAAQNNKFWAIIQGYAGNGD